MKFFCEWILTKMFPFRPTGMNIGCTDIINPIEVDLDNGMVSNDDLIEVFRHTK